MGAGVLPFSLVEGKVLFLFQTTFSGSKAGFLTDFGGGLATGEDYRQTAIREFVEETETMYFCDDLSLAVRSEERILAQIAVVEALFEQTLRHHPDWWCRRHPGNPVRPKDWLTFFVEFPYRDLDPLNREWQIDQSGRFKKRRELHWVAADELLAIYEHSPENLWKRVRQLQNAQQTILSILQTKQTTD